MPEALGLIGILASLALLMWLAFRDWVLGVDGGPLVSLAMWPCDAPGPDGPQ